MSNKPKIAIVGSNILSNLGLKGLLEKIIPFADIYTFSKVMEMTESGDNFFHYFVMQEVMEKHLDFFTQYSRKTIVLCEGENHSATTPFHYINIKTTLSGLLKQFLVLEQMVHNNYAHFPAPMAQALKNDDVQNGTTLTKREVQILQDIAKGKSSKEIAEKLHISLSTVLTHRKNIMTKTKSHSATRLVVYAVHHNFIKPEEIK